MMNSVRNFLSKGDLTAVYKHNDGPVNTFYDTTYSSILGVAFNDNPSSNKVFKSMSLEGSDSLKSRVHDFAPATATESPSDNRYYETKPAKNMGGILYNNFGNSDKVITGVSMHYVGEVNDINDVSTVNDEGVEEVFSRAFEAEVDTSYSSYSPTNADLADVKYGFYFPDDNKFYFGSDIVIDDEGDGETDDDDGEGDETDFFDNCDTLQLYSETQVYQTVFYPDIGFIYMYMPNNVPVGGYSDVNVTFVGNLSSGLPSSQRSSSSLPPTDDIITGTASQVAEGDDYYDPDRWAWRFPVSEAGTYSVRANSYAGAFIDENNVYVEGYADQVCTFGGYNFGQLTLALSDINQSLLCSQLEAVSSYAVSPDPDSVGLEGLGVVTITIGGDLLQDPEFSSAASNAFLITQLAPGSLTNYESYEPTSIAYDSSTGVTTIVFEGIPPNTPSNPFWKFAFNNSGCNETFLSWSGLIFVPPPEAEDVCGILNDALSQAALDTVGTPEGPAYNPEWGVNISTNQLAFGLDEAFLSTLESVLANSGLDEGLWTQYLGNAAQANTDTLTDGANLRINAIRLDDDTGEETEYVVDLGGFVPAFTSVIIFSQANTSIAHPPGDYAFYLKLDTCSTGSDDYGVKISTDYWAGAPEGNCDNTFRTPGFNSDYWRWTFAGSPPFRNIYDAGTSTKGEFTLEFDYLGFSDFDLDDYVFFLSGPTVGTPGSPPLDFGGNLPHFDESVPIVYVQDGGQNFENDNDIESTWTYLSDGTETLRIFVRNLPILIGDFDESNFDTFSTYYSWGLISKSCVNNSFSDPESSYDGDFYSSNSPWSDTYGINGSLMADSLTSEYGGALEVEVSSSAIEFFEFEPDLSLTGMNAALADFDQDGAVATGDLLAFLAAFGQAYNATSLGLYPSNPTAERLPSVKRTDVDLVDLAGLNFSLSQIPSSMSDVGTSYTKISPTSASIQIATPNDGIAGFVKSDDFPSNAQLFAFVAPNVSGDELRGQTAELLLNLGQEDFELFAVNLNYELLNADHTK
jgi:hypothetical protein